MALLPLNKETLLDFFFPQRCLGCGRIGAFLCELCQENLPFLELQYCAVCGAPSIGGFTHQRCRNRFRPDRLLCLFSYQDLVRTLIQSFKYQRVTALKKLMTDLIANFFEENSIDLGVETLISFVPIHPLKLLERGFNQSQIVAEALASRLGLRAVNLLEKVKETKSQTELKREDRQSNVEASFDVNAKMAEAVSDRDILLIDDVFTTGATLLECSKVLKKGGARFIYLLTLAKD